MERRGGEVANVGGRIAESGLECGEGGGSGFRSELTEGVGSEGAFGRAALSKEAKQGGKGRESGRAEGVAGAEGKEANVKGGIGKFVDQGGECPWEGGCEFLKQRQGFGADRPEGIVDRPQEERKGRWRRMGLEEMEKSEAIVGKRRGKKGFEVGESCVLEGGKGTKEEVAAERFAKEELDQDRGGGGGGERAEALEGKEGLAELGVVGGAGRLQEERERARVEK